MNQHPVVCYGEVLWDILPQEAVAGGAPMNVAYHLHMLRKNPAVITRIGLDKLGEELLNVFSARGVCTDYFQVDFDRETGKVYALPGENNEMTYDIVSSVAWDYIEWEEALSRLVSQASYFVFGSLATRNTVSRNTLFQLLESATQKVLDINLRPPHFNRRMVEDLLSRADLLKLNLAELELITGWFANYNSVEDRIKSIADQFRIPAMVVTMGGDGAVFYNGEFFRHDGFRVEVADTIGSGDAFLAGILSCQLDKGTPEEALEFASGMGAFVATQTGACPVYEVEEVHQLIKEKKNLKAI
jgi:fructokinase